MNTQILKSLTVGLSLGAVAYTASAATTGYYRFEDGTNAVDWAQGNTIIDSSGNSNTLNVFAIGGGGNASSTIPGATIPQTGAGNTLSSQFNGGQDIYGNNVGLTDGVGADFTIESYVSFSALGAWETVVGRDNATDEPAQGAAGLFYLSKRGTDNTFRTELTTDTGASLKIENTAPIVVAGTWYHLAVVGNSTAGTLELFLDGSSIGSTAGYTGLYNSTGPENWTLGRGWFGGVADNVTGHIDEVRFSDSALSASEFLNAVPEPGTYALLAGASALAFVMLRRRRA